MPKGVGIWFSFLSGQSCIICNKRCMKGDVCWICVVLSERIWLLALISSIIVSVNSRQSIHEYFISVVSKIMLYLRYWWLFLRRVYTSTIELINKCNAHHSFINSTFQYTQNPAYSYIINYQFNHFFVEPTYMMNPKTIPLYLIITPKRAREH